MSRRLAEIVSYKDGFAIYYPESKKYYKRLDENGYDVKVYDDVVEAEKTCESIGDKVSTVIQ